MVPPIRNKYPLYTSYEVLAYSIEILIIKFNNRMNSKTFMICSNESNTIFSLPKRFPRFPVCYKIKKDCFFQRNRQLEGNIM